ncbi:TcaA NTF2-like domain-containing protein [Clostridium sp. DL1XJH146]
MLVYYLGDEDIDKLQDSVAEIDNKLIEYNEEKTNLLSKIDSLIIEINSYDNEVKEILNIEEIEDPEQEKEEVVDEENSEINRNSNDELSSSTENILKDLIINFDNAWIEYVNDGSQNIYNYIVPGSEVDKDINNFNRNGTKEEFLDIEVKDIEIEDNNAYIKVYEKIKKIENDKETIKEYNWIYHCPNIDEEWLVSDYTKDNSMDIAETSNEINYDICNIGLDFTSRLI